VLIPLSAYNVYKALQGKRSGTSVWQALKATNQLGVTHGQLIKANHSDKTLQK
jgi:putative protease